MTRFLDKHYQADFLLQFVYQQIKKVDGDDADHNAILEMAKQSYIVTLISEFEIFLKGTIKKFDWTNEPGYVHLLSAESINLYEAHRMFVSGNVSREAIIAEHYSFQNIAQIDHVFTQLTGKNFLQEIAKAEAFNVNGKLRTFEDHMTTSKVDNWKKHLVLAYERRHRIIHEGFDDYLDTKEVKTFGMMLVNLMLTITFYVNTTQKKKQ